MNFSIQPQIRLFFFVLVLIVECSGAFEIPLRESWKSFQTEEVRRPTTFISHGQKVSLTVCASTRSSRSEKEDETTFLMKPFSTASGEVVNPYKILNVSRGAERNEIREAYRKMSKRYHPDIVRHKDVLPGRCNNHDDVEAEWERIQISYNILSEKKTRMKYDRHEVINDPGAAMQRALLGAAVASVVGIGKGIFHIGSSALGHILGESGERIREGDDSNQS